MRKTAEIGADAKTAVGQQRRTTDRRERGEHQTADRDKPGEAAAYRQSEADDKPAGPAVEGRLPENAVRGAAKGTEGPVRAAVGAGTVAAPAARQQQWVAHGDEQYARETTGRNRQAVAGTDRDAGRAEGSERGEEQTISRNRATEIAAGRAVAGGASAGMSSGSRSVLGLGCRSA